MIKYFFENTKPVGQLVGLILIFALCFILSMGFLVMAMLIWGKTDMLLMQAINQLVCFGMTAVSFAWLFYGHPFKYLRFESGSRFGWKLLGALLVFVFVIPLSDWLTQVNDGWHFSQQFSGLEERLRSRGERSQAMIEPYLLQNGYGRLALNLLFLAIIPALSEEVLFRGVLQQLLCRVIHNVHLVIWLTAAFFSFFHFEFFAFLPRFVLGLVLGYVFFYGGSIWYGVFIHLVNNGMVVMLYYARNQRWIHPELLETFHTPWYIALVCMTFAVVVFRLFFLKEQGHYLEELK